jgi:hypothetical protein
MANAQLISDLYRVDQMRHLFKRHHVYKTGVIFCLGNMHALLLLDLLPVFPANGLNEQF